MNGTDITMLDGRTGGGPPPHRRGVSGLGAVQFPDGRGERRAAVAGAALADPVIALMVWLKLKAVGLAGAGALLPHQLSGGMKKRAAIARAMALDPDILVFDEPSAGLDPIVAAGIDELILFLKRAFGMTVLVVTHAMESAERIADRLAMLHEGELIAVGDQEHFFGNDHPRLRQFLDRQPERVSGDRAEGFAASFLRWIDHEH